MYEKAMMVWVNAWNASMKPLEVQSGRRDDAIEILKRRSGRRCRWGS
jgi:hypothetical protein